MGWDEGRTLGNKIGDLAFKAKNTDGEIFRPAIVKARFLNNRRLKNILAV